MLLRPLRLSGVDDVRAGVDELFCVAVALLLRLGVGALLRLTVLPELLREADTPELRDEVELELRLLDEALLPRLPSTRLCAINGRLQKQRPRATRAMIAFLFMAFLLFCLLV